MSNFTSQTTVEYDLEILKKSSKRPISHRLLNKTHLELQSSLHIVFDSVNVQIIKFRMAFNFLKCFFVVVKNSLICAIHTNPIFL